MNDGKLAGLVEKTLLTRGRIAKLARRVALLSLLALLGAPATGLGSNEFLVTGEWTGVGVIAYPSRNDENLCAKLRIEPGQHRSVRVQVDWRVFHGWSVAPDSALHKEQASGTLVCGPMLDIWGHTTGPGAGGISVPCPAGNKPLFSGAGVYHTPHGHLTQTHGGFGHNDDGFWNYKFHNWSGDTAYIQLWGVCWRGR